MKNYIDFSFDIVSKAVQKRVIQQEYKENIVFQWLKRPCLMYCKDSKVLSQENLFYICFQLLDTLKQCNDLTDCYVQNEMQCIPYEVERIFDQSKYAGDTYQCASDRLLVILTLHVLLCMIDYTMDQLQVRVLAKYLLNDLDYIIPDNIPKQWYSQLYNEITAALTQDSPIYKRSFAIMASADCCEIDEPNLVDYIEGYMVSPQKISAEIASHKEHNPTEDCPTAETATLTQERNSETEQLRAQIKTLEESLLKKDEDIAALQAKQQDPVPDNSAVLLNENKQLKQELEELQEQKQQLLQNLQSYAQPVHIVKGKKSKAATIFSAMFYANYFQCDNNLNKNECVAAILQRIFNDSSNSIPQLVSSYLDKGTLDQLKQELIDTLSDLQHAKNTDRTLR